MADEDDDAGAPEAVLGRLTGPEILEGIEVQLLGSAPSLTRVEVAERAEVPIDVAERLWHSLGFPRAGRRRGGVRGGRRPGSEATRCG